MKIKAPYESPEINLIVFDATDIITTSGGGNIEEDPGTNDGEWM